MNKLQALVLTLVTILVAKAVVLGINLPEALIALSLIGYQSFLSFLEWKKTKEIEQSFEKRLIDVERKLSILNLGKSFIK